MIKKSLSLLNILFLIGFNAQHAVAEEKTVVISIDNYPPYLDARRNDKGSLGKIVQQVFSEHKIKPVFEFMSWPETQLKISAGNGFTFMWYKSEQTENDWIYSEPLSYLTTQLLFLKDKKIQFDRIDQLRKYKVGLTHGYSYGSVFDHYKTELKLVESQSDYQGIKQLLNGQSDVLLVEPSVAQSLIKDWFSDEMAQFVFQEVNYLTSQPVYLVCSQKYAACAHSMQLFNQSLRRLKAQNTITK
ncbi:substrate-binding periplasmic protein [Pseudoalteromonas tunicata]|uniref:substrate-binding periplasmic protein n=1 Tax=Pseudoalteromonas tunicata TaxID=314281 RepID=UPI00273E58AE|nr:transporter substrate-binding domain-containing protein [Pseudoalteromonas tunicata]MDP4982273.1 transporter substrate-binding domain-containing protein [Pseudoalteromonas tunicata]